MGYRRGMGVWDHLRKAKEAGQRILERIDEVEREVRESDPDKDARKLAFGRTEVELSGGIDDLGDLGYPDPIDGLDEELEIDEDDHLFFSSIEAVGSEEDVLGLNAIDVDSSDALDEDSGELYGMDLFSEEGTQVNTREVGGEKTLIDEHTVAGPGSLNPLTTGDGFDLVELTALEEFTGSEELTPVELTSTGESTQTLKVDLGNSLGFDEQQLASILRFDHYPQLHDAPIRLLVELSRYEQELMRFGEELGVRCFKLLKEVVAEDEDWEAAVWTTGAHWDHAVREAMASYEQDQKALAARALGWAFWPFTDELLMAAVGLEDPLGLSDVIAEIEKVLDARWARVEGGVEPLEAEGDHLPVVERGIFAFEGFRWEL